MADFDELDALCSLSQSSELSSSSLSLTLPALSTASTVLSILFSSDSELESKCRIRFVRLVEDKRFAESLLFGLGSDSLPSSELSSSKVVLFGLFSQLLTFSLTTDLARLKENIYL